MVKRHSILKNLNIKLKNMIIHKFNFLLIQNCTHAIRNITLNFEKLNTPPKLGTNSIEIS